MLLLKVFLLPFTLLFSLLKFIVFNCAGIIVEVSEGCWDYCYELSFSKHREDSKKRNLYNSGVFFPIPPRPLPPAPSEKTAISHHKK